MTDPLKLPAMPFEQPHPLRPAPDLKTWPKTARYLRK